MDLQILSKKACGLVKWPPEYIAKYCATCGKELNDDDLNYLGDHGLCERACIKCETMGGLKETLSQYCRWSGESLEEVRARLRDIQASRKRYCVIMGDHARSFCGVFAGYAKAPSVHSNYLNDSYNAVADMVAHEKIIIITEWNPERAERFKASSLAKQIPGLRFVFAVDSRESLDNVLSVFPEKSAFGYIV